MPSLQLELGVAGTTVVLRAGEGYEADLRSLAPRFRSAVQKGPGVIELELSDLLANLRELGAWPTPAQVHWQPELQAVVEGNVADANRVSGRLENPAGADELSPSETRARLGTGWQAPLTEFQLRDIAKLLSLNHGANFSVPGAGKTRATLAVFQALREAGIVRRLLVVCPKSAYESWQFENTEAFPGAPLRAQILEQRPDPSAQMVLVNYERLPAVQVALGHWLSAEPAMLILDEAHRMKLGAAGAYGSACLALGPRARRRLILTGTPAPNGAKDLENLMGFVWPGQGQQVVTRAIAGGDLRRASSVLQPLFTRTTKSELDLPPVVPHVRRVELPSLHREIYQALVGEMSGRAARSADDLESLGRILMYLLMAAVSPALLAAGTTRYEPLVYRVPPLDVPANASLMRLLEDLPSFEMSPKYQEVIGIVAANAAAGRKTLVWSTFIRSLTTLESMLRKFHPALVHGGTPDEERAAQLKRFREDPDCLVLLSNPATLGEGISLHQVCHDAVYVDRDFAAGRYLQSLDRIHRLGLKPGTITNVSVIVASGTIDEIVEQRLGTKLEFMGTILNDAAVRQLADLEEEPAIGGGLDRADLRALLEYLDGTAAP